MGAPKPITVCFFNNSAPTLEVMMDDGVSEIDLAP